MKPLQLYDIDFKVWETEKANEIDNTLGWFQTYQFSIVTKFNSHREVESNVNLVVQLKKDYKLPRTTFSNSVENLSLVGKVVNFFGFFLNFFEQKLKPWRPWMRPYDGP